jgi:hypothetical protein
MKASLPAVGRADGGVHRVPALTVALDPAVRKLDPRPLLGFGDEAHLDLARAAGIGLDRPVERDVPAEHEP